MNVACAQLLWRHDLNSFFLHSYFVFAVVAAAVTTGRIRYSLGLSSRHSSSVSRRCSCAIRDGQLAVLPELLRSVRPQSSEAVLQHSEILNAAKNGIIPRKASHAAEAEFCHRLGLLEIQVQILKALFILTAIAAALWTLLVANAILAGVVSEQTTPTWAVSDIARQDLQSLFWAILLLLVLYLLYAYLRARLSKERSNWGLVFSLMSGTSLDS